MFGLHRSLTLRRRRRFLFSNRITRTHILYTYITVVGTLFIFTPPFPSPWRTFRHTPINGDAISQRTPPPYYNKKKSVYTTYTIHTAHTWVSIFYVYVYRVCPIPRSTLFVQDSWQRRCEVSFGIMISLTNKI